MRLMLITLTKCFKAKFTTAEQGALSPAKRGQVFSPVRFSFSYRLPVNRFPTQPVPQG